MNSVIKAIKERRSIRAFKPDMPPKEDIEQIVEAGLYAPNGMGMQETITIAITKITIPSTVNFLREMSTNAISVKVKIAQITMAKNAVARPMWSRSVLLIFPLTASARRRKSSSSLIPFHPFLKDGKRGFFREKK